MSIMRNYMRVMCEDGFSVSIHAGDGKYCCPRNNEGPYIEVELGYPSHSEFMIIPWAEDRHNPTETVYGYVPSTVVLEMLLKHGGMVEGELPPMVMGYSDNYPNNEGR